MGDICDQVNYADYMMTSSNGNIFRVTGHLCAQRPVTQSFDVFFDLHLNKRLSKQSWGWWFETLSRPVWLHCNDLFCQQGRLLGSVIWGIRRCAIWNSHWSVSEVYQMTLNAQKNCIKSKSNIEILILLTFDRATIIRATQLISPLEMCH